MITAAFFAGMTLLALLGLCAVALHDVPAISGSVAVILTIAALGLAICTGARP
jgi:hypothetical protein